MLSVVYGQAFEVDIDDNIINHPNVRSYVVNGRAFIGSDTWEIEHFCGMECFTPPEDWNSTRFGDVYVNLNNSHQGYFATADIQEFDPSDDPYILCDGCGEELVRDDEAYEAMYGRPIKN